MKRILIEQSISIVMILFLLCSVYELLRNNEVYHIRTKWIETSDNRHSKYTYQDMYLPSGDNWYGLKFPRDSDFK